MLRRGALSLLELIVIQGLLERFAHDIDDDYFGWNQVSKLVWLGGNLWSQQSERRKIELKMHHKCFISQTQENLVENIPKLI